MNKIETLIQELCPNGVEKKELSQISRLTRGKVMSKQFLEENSGDFPVYSSQTRNRGEIGKISTYDFDGEYITWTTDGANAGTVFYRNGKFSITNVCGLIDITDNNLSIKYLYYILSISTKKYVSSGMGNPKLMSNVVGKIKIPIPPLEIQEEIVKILDKFTDYVTELTTELTLRQKQYNYYREKLFTFEDEVKKINLSELSHYIKSGKNSVRNIVGNYPVYASTGQIGFSDSYEYNHSQILVARVGAYAGKVYTATGKYDVTDNTLMISVDNNKINFQYLYYYLVNFGLNKLAKGAGQPLITGKQLKELKVPVPSIESQKEIVMFLDKLDIVSNDLNAGLPKEIELRQKQYEFYRDKLLSFD